MPVRPIELPSESETWAAVDEFLTGWEDIVRLSACEDILAWVVSYIYFLGVNRSRLYLPLRF